MENLKKFEQLVLLFELSKNQLIYFLQKYIPEERKDEVKDDIMKFKKRTDYQLKEIQKILS